MATPRSLFQSLALTPQSSARKIHICRLYDIIQLSLLRNDLTTARKAWVILARCKEIPWITLWPTAVRILGDERFDPRDTSRKIEFLRDLLSRPSDQKVSVLKEIVLRYIIAGKRREALEELEIYLPSMPYHDDAALHAYAGLLSLYLSQPSQSEGQSGYNQALLLSAETNLHACQKRDPDSPVVQHFLLLLKTLAGDHHASDSEDEEARIKTDSRSKKRIRRQRSDSIEL
ncbi:hypothetical protein CYLTODRAFT_420448 [Cylindrobasidium torrendii FP15055 ss-10]|uniref:ER membrane protein complex subunit 2 n=1 Tax=Cylindrobasidium torrendii FP15055 ss-10 TaxID=1314674 RepID=A0A0D7BHU4_9AGAR|nr:hypothetical protein CYLTODRAFT_420448 [Cylindrobasidium torrendii FP15055 ss-10]